jgi:hypothetical protein
LSIGGYACPNALVAGGAKPPLDSHAIPGAAGDKYKDVNIGQVTKVELASDSSEVTNDPMAWRNSGPLSPRALEP